MSPIAKSLQRVFRWQKFCFLMLQVIGDMQWRDFASVVIINYVVDNYDGDDSECDDDAGDYDDVLCASNLREHVNLCGTLRTSQSCSASHEAVQHRAHTGTI